MLYNLVDRAINLCNEKFHDENLEKIKSFRIQNDYPIWFIEKFVKILVVQLKSGSEFEKKCIV